MTSYRWVALGAAWTAVGIALGAFGAHALEERLTAAGRVATWETAVDYHVWHGLGLVLFGLLRRAREGDTAPGSRGGLPGVLFLLGSLLFSGSLYGLSLGGPGAVFGPVTPLGGILLLGGWIALARGALAAERASRDA